MTNPVFGIPSAKRGNFRAIDSWRTVNEPPNGRVNSLDEIPVLVLCLFCVIVEWKASIRST
jgi:hypothetical protein